jgi:ribosomal protein S18 acetylase RimI-like enzyme
MNEEPAFELREIVETDSSWIKNLMVSSWGSQEVVVRGNVFLPHLLSGYVAVTFNGERIGLVTYRKLMDHWEIITLNSINPGTGIGTALVSEIRKRAREDSCSKIVLTTTNDNIQALDFYQKHGFRIREIRLGAVDQARKIKPSIPEFSSNGIPVRDEIDLELDLNQNEA